MSAAGRARHPLRVPALIVVRLAGTMPWGTLLGGGIAGLAIAALGYLLAGRADAPAMTLLAARAAVGALAIGVAFAVTDPQRALVTTLPVRGWMLTTARAALALPAVALTVWAVAAMARAQLRTELEPLVRPPGATQATAIAAQAAIAQAPATLAAEGLAATVLAFALACAVARTRWADLGGIVAAPASLAIIGLLALAAPALFPEVPLNAVTAKGAELDPWPTADACCLVLTAAALAIASAATRDPWHRLPSLPRTVVCHWRHWPA